MKWFLSRYSRFKNASVPGLSHNAGKGRVKSRVSRVSHLKGSNRNFKISILELWTKCICESNRSHHLKLMVEFNQQFNAQIAAHRYLNIFQSERKC